MNIKLLSVSACVVTSMLACKHSANRTASRPADPQEDSGLHVGETVGDGAEGPLAPEDQLDPVDLVKYTGGQCARLWPTTDIRYTATGFRGQAFPYQAALDIAVATINKFTPIKLSKTSKSKYVINYVHANPPGGTASCGATSANVMVSSLSQLPMRYQTKTIVHETMHTLGFAHEQQRNDRDRYVTPTNVSTTDFNQRILGTPACDGPFDRFSVMFNWQDRYPAKPGFEKGYGPSGQGNSYPLTYADLASLWRLYGGKPSMTCYPPPHAMVAVKQQTRNSTEFNVTYEANGAAALYHYVVTPSSVQTTPEQCLASPLTFPANAATLVLNTTSQAPGEYRISICPQSIEIPAFVSGNVMTYEGGSFYTAGFRIPI